MTTSMRIRSGILPLCFLVATATLPCATAQPAPDAGSAPGRFRWKEGEVRRYEGRATTEQGRARSRPDQRVEFVGDVTTSAVDFVERETCDGIDADGRFRLSYGWDRFAFEARTGKNTDIKLEITGRAALRKAVGVTQAINYAGFVEAPLRYRIDDVGIVDEVKLPRPIMSFDADRIVDGYRGFLQSRHAPPLAEVGPVGTKVALPTWSFRESLFGPMGAFPEIECRAEVTRQADETIDGVAARVYLLRLALDRPFTVKPENRIATVEVTSFHHSTISRIGLESGMLLHTTSESEATLRISPKAEGAKPLSLMTRQTSERRLLGTESKS